MSDSKSITTSPSDDFTYDTRPEGIRKFEELYVETNAIIRDLIDNLFRMGIAGEEAKDSTFDEDRFEVPSYLDEENSLFDEMTELSELRFEFMWASFDYLPEVNVDISVSVNGMSESATIRREILYSLGKPNDSVVRDYDGYWKKIKRRS